MSDDQHPADLPAGLPADSPLRVPMSPDEPLPAPFATSLTPEEVMATEAALLDALEESGSLHPARLPDLPPEALPHLQEEADRAP